MHRRINEVAQYLGVCIEPYDTDMIDEYGRTVLASVEAQGDIVWPLGRCTVNSSSRIRIGLFRDPPMGVQAFVNDLERLLDHQR